MLAVMNWSRNLPILLAILVAAFALNSSWKEGVPALEIYAVITLTISCLLALTLRQTRLLFLSILLVWSAFLAPLLVNYSAQPLISSAIYKLVAIIAVCLVTLFSDGPFRRQQTLVFALLLGMISLAGFSSFGLSTTQLESWGVATLLPWELVSLTELDALLLSIPVMTTLIHFALTRQADLSYVVVSCFVLLLINNPDLITRLWLLISVEGALLIVLLLTMSQRVWRDSLTGLPGRQRLDSDLKRMPVGSLAAFIDIDHFKKFNTKYGHANGDIVLQRVAKDLARCGFAQAYRYGGEEFVLLTKPMSLERFTAQLDSLRERIGTRRFQLTPMDVNTKGAKGSGVSGKTKKAVKEKAISVNISAGVSKLLLSMSHQDWLKQADDALYRAKSSGRNCVVVTKTLIERRSKKR